MKNSKFGFKVLFTLLLVSNLFVNCKQKEVTNTTDNKPTDMSTLENEIELRLREYENYLEKGDSMALGDMYMPDAKVIPSINGREDIIKVFSAMIKDSVIGSFETTNLWGNDELLVEEGKGEWSNKKGENKSTGTYLLVWKKDDGTWKILRDTWFPDKKN